MTCTDKIVLLTGERSVGKTYLCQQVVRQARKKGYSCAGVLSPALFADTEKVGINLVDVATGDTILPVLRSAKKLRSRRSRWEKRASRIHFNALLLMTSFV